MSKYRFDSVARSERYFTATLFSHILLGQNFLGLRSLFRTLSIDPSAEARDEFELVSELDPLRDGALASDEIRALFQQHGRLAVPDLFLRWDSRILVIESKFFSAPSDADLLHQVTNQKQAIDLVLSGTLYEGCEISYAVLTVQGASVARNPGQEILTCTWSDLLASLRRGFRGFETPDIEYCFDVLDAAEKRAAAELAETELQYERVSNVRTLMSSLDDLLERGLIYVGFTGGEGRLMEASLQNLEQRGHYKISDVRWSNNWVRIDQLVSRYLVVKIASSDLVE